MAYAAATINAVGLRRLQEPAFTIIRLKPLPTLTWSAGEAPGRLRPLGKDVTTALFLEPVVLLHVILRILRVWATCVA